MAIHVQAPQLSAPVPGLKLTADEFARLYAGKRFELINGIPVELPMPQQLHGKVSYRITMALGTHVDG